MQSIKKLRLAVLLTISVLIFSLSIYWQYFIQTTINVPASGLLFHIQSGNSFREAAASLKEKKVIKSAWLFEVLARVKFRNIEQTIKAGEYKLTPNMTPGNVLEAFHLGSVYQRLFTIKEGETSRKLLKELKQAEGLHHQLSYKNEAKMLQQLRLTDYTSLEGLFLPETYHYVSTASDVQLLTRANRALMRHLTKDWAKRDLKTPYLNAYQALIMASIIEKEAADMLDRKKVSSVFANRLRLRMKLQADPTVIYGLKDAYKNQLTKTQLRSKSPYNTYLNYGLPPTPIAMVSLGALHAALHPEWSSALFFVSDGQGKHIFTETLQKHNEAVKKYLRQNQGN